MRGPAVLGGLLACAAAVATPNAASQGADAMLTACPGGQAWLAAEQARHASLRLPPESPPKRPPVRDELLRMQRDDQAARAAFGQGRAPTRAEETVLVDTDARHLRRLKAIIGDGGFPAAADVGRDGVAAAWLLVQHADADPGFQQRILSGLEGLGEADGISGEQVALLTDRVLLAQGKPQRYGSQYQGNPGEPPSMRPVEDPAGLDERRARMHMMPSATYACFLSRMSMGHAAPAEQTTP